MTKSGLVVTGSILLTCLIYALSPGPKLYLQHPTNWELRNQVIYLSGVCSISLMVASMLISARINWISKNDGRT